MNLFVRYFQQVTFLFLINSKVKFNRTSPNELIIQSIPDSSLKGLLLCRRISQPQARQIFWAWLNYLVTFVNQMIYFTIFPLNLLPSSQNHLLTTSQMPVNLMIVPQFASLPFLILISSLSLSKQDYLNCALRCF